ncbi:flagellar hook protein FlgE [Marinospirillum perlucidum]|uniref:flagellar hook protein FlgE n=1 Tax=Marinospirillum perlucidum TaxID=1982602 RepID=UPI000DF1C4D2|nr:flagellar hook protein FlgE [Marinospirillum perlucidum]
MSFNIGLSGLRGAQMDLSVTGNNISNASTVGFKQSRAEFGDVYASAVLGTGKNSVGSGVLVERIFQQHTQGNIDYTDNALDLAINGNGYFIVSEDGQTQYTRAGYFGLDKDGYIVNNTGKRLQGYEADLQGNIQSGALGDVRISQSNVEPNATSEVDVEFNLDATDTVLDPTTFDPTDSTTYSYANSTTTYDSLGNPHTLREYFIKVDPSNANPLIANSYTGGNAWAVVTTLDGNMYQNDGSGTTVAADAWSTSGNTIDDFYHGMLLFNEEGGLAEVHDAVAGGGIDPTTGGGGTTTNANQRINLDVAGQVAGAYFGQAGATQDQIEFNILGSTQYGAESAVQSQTQDGYTTGRLAGMEVSEDGTIFGRYTNGQNRAIGQVPIATFTSPENLKAVGSTAWVETFESGIPTVNMAGTGITGVVEGGALEGSTVDLSEQLVNMIIAQRNYQANAKTIQTQDTLTQTIINLR